MKLFQDSRGFIISFGFDMIARKPNQHGIWWCDPTTKEWEPSVANQAGYIEFQRSLTTEFVKESNGTITAYQPGMCIEMTFIGGNLVWLTRFLEAS